MSDLDNPVDRLMHAAGTKKVKDLAEIIGVKPNRVSMWRQRGEIPVAERIKATRAVGCSDEWVETGKGEARQASSEFRYTHPVPEVEALVEEGLGEYSGGKMTLTRDEVRVVQMWRGLSEERKYQAIMVLMNGYMESKDEGKGKD